MYQNPELQKQYIWQERGSHTARAIHCINIEWPHFGKINAACDIFISIDEKNSQQQLPEEEKIPSSLQLLTTLVAGMLNIYVRFTPSMYEHRAQTCMGSSGDVKISSSNFRSKQGKKVGGDKSPFAAQPEIKNQGLNLLSLPPPAIVRNDSNIVQEKQHKNIQRQLF